MTAQGSEGLPTEEPTLAALIEALDPEVRGAIDEVDRTPIALSLQQSPWDRLRSHRAALAAIADRFADVRPTYEIVTLSR
jgi:hypothetical protein